MSYLTKTPSIAFNASEIGGLLGLLNAYRPNTGLIGIITRKYPSIFNKSELAVTAKKETADLVASVVVNSKKYDEEKPVETVLKTDTKDTRDIIEAAEKILENPALLSRITLSMDANIDTIVKHIVDEPIVPATPAPSPDTKPVFLTPEFVDKRDRVSKILSDIVDTKDEIDKSVQKSVFTREGIKQESNVIRLLEEKIDDTIGGVSLLVIELEPEEIYDRFNCYSECSITIRCRPDGICFKDNRFVEIKNRMTRIFGGPAKYEIPQVLSYGMLVPEKPVLFVEYNKKTGDIQYRDYSYTDEQMSSYIRGLVNIGNFVMGINKKPELVDAISKMTPDAISSMTDDIVKGKYM